MRATFVDDIAWAWAWARVRLGMARRVHDRTPPRGTVIVLDYERWNCVANDLASIQVASEGGMPSQRTKNSSWPGWILDSKIASGSGLESSIEDAGSSGS